MARFTGLLGLITFLGVCYLLSTNRRAIRWRTVAWGLSLQLFFAVIVTQVAAGRNVLKVGADAVTALVKLGYSEAQAAEAVARAANDMGDQVETGVLLREALRGMAR